MTETETSRLWVMVAQSVLSAIPAGFPSQHLILLDTRFSYSRQTQDDIGMMGSRRIGQNQYVIRIMQSNKNPSYPCLKGRTLRHVFSPLSGHRISMSVIITCSDGALKIWQTASLDIISELEAHIPYEHHCILRQS